ncbi:MAG: hypothetical protein PHV33_13490 [Elusimicrobiales bacterium]|nr:hypothetical protein [Elusimicrobiales bacterium]
MTTQQLTMLGMAAVGAGLFFGGRHFAKKFASDQPTFIPAAMVTARGVASYVSTVAAWAGLALACVCLFLLFD